MLILFDDEQELSNSGNKPVSFFLLAKLTLKTYIVRKAHPVVPDKLFSFKSIIFKLPISARNGFIASVKLFFDSDSTFKEL